MHARSIIFLGRPANIAAGIAFVKNEVGPMLDQIDGCRGLSLLVDRETGQCIATSSWDSEAAMVDSDEMLRPVRDRGRDVFGGSMQVDEWTIAMMHRTHHGESCRVSWLQGDADVLTETFRLGILPRLEQTRGFCSASLLVNRSNGLGCVTTGWKTRDEMQAAGAATDDLTRSALAEAGCEVLEVRAFDLVYAHLHVPQMV
ncbi:MAG TPA: hypothetical protein VFK52_07685 [Nocardioidaceae bacterium]|nr:hypothetical protein [Nocardioidaceae bacterium]